MQPLPWLLVHGPVVWRAGLALMLAGALVVGRALPRRAARRAAEAARRRLGPALTSLRDAESGGVATVGGRIHLEDGAMRLEVGDERLAIEGPTEIAAGSREA